MAVFAAREPGLVCSFALYHRRVLTPPPVRPRRSADWSRMFASTVRSCGDRCVDSALSDSDATIFAKRFS